ncbi:DUF1275 domain-containing protein [Candidatus Pacearchaeota archaeon]|nr:DUF1275 domain-containing protein [Candidatus Pacearchaeota archaeon]
MGKVDYEVGVYKSGKFTPYGSNKSYSAKIDTTTRNELLTSTEILAENGREVHGSYKDGNFRPADIRGTRGYVNHVTLQNGQTFNLDHHGDLYESDSQRGHTVFVGQVDKNGKLVRKKEYAEKLRKDVKEMVRAWKSMPEPALTDTYEQLQKIGRQMYQEMVIDCTKAGIGEEEVLEYGRQMGIPKKEAYELAGDAVAGGLETLLNSKTKRIMGFVGLGGVILSILFFSSNMTGNVIGLNQTSTNWIGGILFLVGLIGVLAYFRKRK